MAEQPSAYLVIRRSDGFGGFSPLTPGKRLVLGRALSNDIVLEDDLCSREHAEVVWHEGRWRLRDLDSLNGTRVNGDRLISEWELAPGDEIHLGRTTLLFVEALGQLSDLPASSDRRQKRPGSRRYTTPSLIHDVISIRVQRWGLGQGVLGTEFARACDLVDGDPDMALTKCRKILEKCLHELHQQRIGPAGTRRLEQLIGDLGRAEVLPRKMLALCEVVRELGNVGAHPIYDDEGLSHREAQLAILTLTLILEWHVRSMKREAPTIELPRAELQPKESSEGGEKASERTLESPPG